MAIEKEWRTPEHILEAVRKCLGGIDLDPCSSAEANKIVRAKEYYTVEDDALTLVWKKGRIFCNPPYRRVMPWAKKCLTAAAYGSEVILLVNSATETKWYQELLMHADYCCLVKGRISFIDSEGKVGKSPRYGTSIFGMGMTGDRFVEAFEDLGVVVPLWE